ncbi:MAG TPA: hypothetical protein VL049_04065 [Candidatus Dormibacteraeota bacterium]|nr:hypothetical protein [Candidatus Dormibacteraeota bacterium]
MSWRRALLLTAGIGAAVIAVGVLFVVARLDSVVQGLVERRGSALVGTAVSVEAVEIALADGRATLRGLSIANPQGFSAPNALTLSEVEVGLDIRSLLADPLVIDTISIVEPHVFYEVNGDGAANIDVIRRNVEAGRRADEAGPADATPVPRPHRRERGAGARKLIIHLLELREGQVTIDAAAAGGSARTETLPAFELTSIGVKQGGASPAEVGRIVLVAVARDVAVAVAADELEKVVGKHLGGLLGDAIKKGGSSAIEGGLGGVLDGLLGGKKKREPASP